MEEEFENKINFLDITISKNENNIQFNTYRKPSTTDIITQNASCHPPEHKLAAVRYLTVYKDTPRIILRKERKMIQ
jgi:hypothetical protein